MARHGHSRGQSSGRSQRQLRVGELVRAILSDVLARGHGVEEALGRGLVTVTEVQVSPDLKVATCFVAPLGGGDPEPLIAALTQMRKSLRGELGRQMTTKFTPELRFAADRSFDQASGVDRILKSAAVQRDLARGGAPDTNEEDESDGA